MFDLNWAAMLASGKTLSIRMDDEESETGMKQFTGTVEGQDGEVFTFKDISTGELIEADIGDLVSLEFAQPKGEGRRVRLTTKGGTEVDGSLLDLNAEELVIKVEDSSGQDQENLFKCPIESASKLEFLGD